jgi:hypothetical protein
MGLRDLIDVEWWNTTPSLRFGSLAAGVHEIKRLPIQGHLYDLRQDATSLELMINQKLGVKVVGDKVVIRKFVRTEKFVEFEMKSSKTTTVWLTEDPTVAQKFIVPAGTNLVRKNIE